MDERGRSKGYAFVEFQDKAATQKALDAREFKLEGRLALIRQSNRQITKKRATRPNFEEKKAKDEGEKSSMGGDAKVKDRKREKKKRFKADLKALLHTETKI